MRLPVYNAPAKKSIEISLPWHSSMIPIADMNHEIVRGKLNKSLKPQNPSKPWSPKDFFGGSGYYVHNTQGYLAKPDSLVVPSRPPPAERTAEDEPFFHVPRNPEDPRTRVDISSGSASLTEEIKTRVTNNEGVLPPLVSLVGGRLSNFVEGWKRITNDPYVLSIVAKGYRLRFTSPPLLRQAPWEIRSPQDPQEILGMREQISLMLQKNAITEVPPDSPGFYSNVFLVRKASGGWRPVIDLKNLNAHIHAPPFRMFTTSSVLSSVEKEFRVQD